MSDQNDRDQSAVHRFQEKSGELEKLIDANKDPEWRYFTAQQYAMSSVVIDLLVETGLVTKADVYERANTRLDVLIEDYKRKRMKGASAS